MKVQNPLIGRSSGKFANAVFYTNLGFNIARSKPITVRNPNTIPQQKGRKKLSTLSKLAKLLRQAVNIGLYDESIAMYPRNMFMKTNNAAVTVDNSIVATVDYAALILAKGSLCTVKDVTADLDSGDLVVDWALEADVIDPSWKIAVITTRGLNEKVTLSIGDVDADENTLTFEDTVATAGDSLWIFAFDPITLESSDSVRVAVTS